jgi:hypothetical protein
LGTNSKSEDVRWSPKDLKSPLLSGFFIARSSFVAGLALRGK